MAARERGEDDLAGDPGNPVTRKPSMPAQLGEQIAQLEANLGDEDADLREQISERRVLVIALDARPTCRSRTVAGNSPRTSALIFTLRKVNAGEPFDR